MQAHALVTLKSIKDQFLNNPESVYTSFMLLVDDPNREKYIKVIEQKEYALIKTYYYLICKTYKQVKEDFDINSESVKNIYLDLQKYKFSANKTLLSLISKYQQVIYQKENELKLIQQKNKDYKFKQFIKTLIQTNLSSDTIYYRFNCNEYWNKFLIEFIVKNINHEELVKIDDSYSSKFLRTMVFISRIDLIKQVYYEIVLDTCITRYRSYFSKKIYDIIHTDIIKNHIKNVFIKVR
jgi:hypothetical protein